MANFNKVILAGNMTRDVQIKTTQGGMTIGDFGLAVNHKYTTKSGESKEDVLFIDCTAFGKTAETLQKWTSKGKPLLVEGRLRFETWEGKDGKRSKHTVTVDNFQFLGDGGKKDAPSEKSSAPQSGFGGVPSDFDDSIPF